MAGPSETSQPEQTSSQDSSASGTHGPEPDAIVLSARARILAFLDGLLGPPLASREQEANKIGPWRGVPALGLDGLGSSAYGPEAALMVLLPLGALGLSYAAPITGLICALLVILYLSYRQTIGEYPNGGGAYTVARQNLGTQAGLIAAAALTVDYVLNVAVGISAGVGALISAFPPLAPHTLSLCLFILAAITIANLRGMRESSFLFGIPTYLFMGSMLVVLGWGVCKTMAAGGHPRPLEPPPPLPAGLAGANIWMLMRAFASGCTAMTGVEAVSNGVTAFAKPVVRNARATLTIIVVTLFLLLAGIAYLAQAYHVGARPQHEPGYQSVLSQLVGAIVGRGPLYYAAIGSLLAVLCLSANTSFAGFPRLCRVIAEDDFLPHAFANLGRRLVYSLGIIILSVMAALLLIAFGGITDRLIPLFAVGAFLAFTFSQAGMVIHWRKRTTAASWLPLAVNGLGAALTLGVLVVIVVAKFHEGAWLTVLIIPALVLLFNRIRSHYRRVDAETQRSAPIDCTLPGEPIIVVPIGGWNSVAEKGLRYAMRLSTRVQAVYVSTEEDDAALLRKQWQEMVERPVRQAGLPIPELVVVNSPYRLLYDPLVDHIKALKGQNPGTYINVLIPELVQTRWYEYLLHNHRALGFKTLLLFQRDPYLITTNVPWYLSAPAFPPEEESGGQMSGN